MQGNSLQVVGAGPEMVMNRPDIRVDCNIACYCEATDAKSRSNSCKQREDLFSQPAGP